MKLLKSILILFIFFGNAPYKYEVKAEIKNPENFRVLSNERLASMYIKTKKPEVAVPLLVETIRIMSPNSQEGKEAYERLIQLGFVETKYKG